MNVNSGHKMRLLICLVLPIAAWCAPALAKNDATADESLQPLLRVKRADEQIMFGNHQNKAQFVKKSDPNIDALHENEATIDKKSSISTQTKPDVKPNDVIAVPNELEATEMNMKDDQPAAVEDVEKGSFDGMDSTEQSSGDTESNMIEKPGEGSYYYDYYYPYGRYRQRRQAIEKRAAGHTALTAEDMDNNEESRAVARSKRDLTAEDIYEWLENGEGSRDYYPEYAIPEVEENPWDALALSQLAEESPYMDRQNELDYSPYGDYSAPEVDPNNKELLSLLEYLVETEAPQKNPLSGLYPNDIKEEWVELEEEPQDTVPYEPIVYNGIPGIFIPMEPENVVAKRQYVGLDPGIKKRNTFYPYQLEPEGGRWGAFVDQQEEKRNVEAYERLVRMAEALNPPSDRYQDEFGYRK